MLDAATIKGFVGSCLIHRFDEPAPIPRFHEELWEMCCDLEEDRIAIAAPRGHSKSTSITLSYLLAVLLFRERQYAIIVSDTEGQAVQFLGDLKVELTDNEDIAKLFGNIILLKDSETKIVAQTEDGYKFRVEAKGSEQKVRGLKWMSKRPDLLICDDLENDEIVMNKERREKFRSWFFKALIPAMSDKGRIIVVGTILHLDSVLERLLNDPHWYTARYKAHNEDFSEILWPERFSKERLERIRSNYVTQGMPEGYSQEYLNYPIDDSVAYFRRDDFRFFDPDNLPTERLSYYSAIDFAITSSERSDYTVIVTVGIDEHNKMYVVDVNRGRWDAQEIIDEMINTQIRYNPELFAAESGMISKSLGPFLKEQMLQTGVFINLKEMVPNKDKETRARSIQARIRQGTVYMDGNADWYPDFEQEMLRFPKDVHDDQVDALAWIGLMLNETAIGRTAIEYEEDAWEEEFGDDYNLYADMGKCATTGY